MGSVGSCLKDELFAYDTPKIVQIKSRFIGVLNRLVQITIILYIIIWVFIVNHGYQYIDTAAISGATTKIKGVSFTNLSDVRVGTRVWDNSDLIVPPQQNGAFFITTNIIITRNQTQSVCPEQEWNKAECKNDSDCEPAGKPFHLGHGVSSGKCNQETGTCMVHAWCPIENDTLTTKKAALGDSKDFTIFIKSHVYFPYYKRMRSNIIEFIDKSYIRSCNYHPVNEPYCPIFRVGDVVSLAENRPADGEHVVLDDSYFEKMAMKGGVISIIVKWDCNFDYKESECKPKYNFARLDNYNGSTIAAGYNFRYPIYLSDGSSDNTPATRDLVKAYGIQFLITTEAQARKFDIVTFFQNVGSGLALLGIASVCCDIFLLYVHRRKNFFKGHIFQNLDQEESGSLVADDDASSAAESGNVPTSNTNGTAVKMSSITDKNTLSSKPVTSESREPFLSN